MKKLYILFFLLVCATVTQAQQLPQLTQYYFNEYVINPAVAGRDNVFDVRTSQRHQWVGITDAPRTYTLSVHGPLFTDKMGVGAYAFTDIVGPTRRTGFQASYAYHLAFSETARLSFSASLGLLHYALDGSKLDLRDEGDPSLANTFESELHPDAKFAVYFYTPKFYAGLTIPNLIQNRLNLYEANSIENRLVPHFMLMAGYRYDINDDWMVEPSLLFKYVNPAPLKMDLTVRVHYKNMIWAGLNYRTGEAFAPAIGYTHKDFLFFGYSYDILTNNLKNYSTGSHEVLVGIRLNKKVEKPSSNAVD